MSAGSGQAENAVTISALVTGGMYAYRYFTEGPSKASELAKEGYVAKYKAFYGSGVVLPLGQWMPAAAITYFVLAVLAEASPQIGTSAAVLVGVGSFTGNVLAVKKDVGKETKAAGKETKPATGSTPLETSLQPLQGTVSENHPPNMAEEAES